MTPPVAPLANVIVALISQSLHRHRTLVRHQRTCHSTRTSIPRIARDVSSAGVQRRRVTRREVDELGSIISGRSAPIKLGGTGTDALRCSRKKVPRRSIRSHSRTVSHTGEEGSRIRISLSLSVTLAATGNRQAARRNDVSLRSVPRGAVRAQMSSIFRKLFEPQCTQREIRLYVRVSTAYYRRTARDHVHRRPDEAPSASASVHGISANFTLFTPWRVRAPRKPCQSSGSRDVTLRIVERERERDTPAGKSKTRARMLSGEAHASLGGRRATEPGARDF